MKAYSVDLEIEIILASQEVLDLANPLGLEGELNFRSFDESINRTIPLILRYGLGKSQQIKVDSNPPNEYLGRATSVTITIQDYHYFCLKEEGFCGDRFGIGGKIIITNPNRKV